ncbi:hypothetical protein LXL04_032954 [Taraxacum kok-saghyz]
MLDTHIGIAYHTTSICIVDPTRRRKGTIVSTDVVLDVFIFGAYGVLDEMPESVYINTKEEIDIDHKIIDGDDVDAFDGAEWCRVIPKKIMLINFEIGGDAEVLRHVGAESLAVSDGCSSATP